MHSPETVRAACVFHRYFERDPHFLWTAGPKPTFSDALYHRDFPHEAQGELADTQRKALAAVLLSTQ